MGDAKPAFFFGQDESGGINGLPFAFAVGHRACRLDPVTDD
jgi:hypothetical protein